jgi:hypothetical protein
MASVMSEVNGSTSPIGRITFRSISVEYSDLYIDTLLLTPIVDIGMTYFSAIELFDRLFGPALSYPHSYLALT